LVNPMEYATFALMRLARRLRLSKLVWMSTSTKNFTDYFKGYEKVEAVRRIFGDQTDGVLKSLKVNFIWFGYMGVDNTNGHLMVNQSYLNTGDKTDIYLDVVHELCHVKQWMEGKELFDPKYDYVDRPTEVEAYSYTVQEAKRLGLNNSRILQYLQVEWMSTQDLKKLIKNMNLNIDPTEPLPK
jgi:hypothetical protein